MTPVDIEPGPVQKLRRELNVTLERLAALQSEHRTVMAERDRAYAELRKQAPCVSAVFDREVWEKAKQAEAAP